jgi:hypothetical protein
MQGVAVVEGIVPVVIVEDLVLVVGDVVAGSGVVHFVVLVLEVRRRVIVVEDRPKDV